MQPPIKKKPEPTWRIVTVTQSHIDKLKSEDQNYQESDFILGKYDVEVTHLDGTKTFYGSYVTKAEAKEAIQEMKKSKAYFK
jgi:hypothetical protein